MNPKNIFIFVVVAAVAGGVIWWATQPPPLEPAKVAAAPVVEAPKPVAPIQQKVALPTMAPVAPQPMPTQPQPVVAQVETPAPSTGDAQAELSTAIPDMINLVQSGDIVTLMDNYMLPEDLAKIPADQKAQMEQTMQTMMQSPQGQQQVQMMTQFLESMKDMTPTLNATGDEAVYQVPPPVGIAPPGANLPATIPVTFAKENGRWYVKQGPGGM